jgi:hypothetical protein
MEWNLWKRGEPKVKSPLTELSLSAMTLGFLIKASLCGLYGVQSTEYLDGWV